MCKIITFFIPFFEFYLRISYNKIEVFDMSSLEVLQSGVEFTKDMYLKVKTEASETDALFYSTNMLSAVLTSDSSSWATAYTRQNNLRENIMALSEFDIKNELLKNMVNVAAYNRLTNSTASMYIGNIFDLNTMTNDAIAVVASNNIQLGNIEEMYSLLDSSEFLERACQCFVACRAYKEKRELIDNVAAVDSLAQQLNNELDIYYARNCNFTNSGYGK